MNIAVIALCAFFFFGAGKPDTSLQILDARTTKPIEGAIVYLEKFNHALRSDRHGRLAVPAEYASGNIDIFAKNYLSQNWSFDKLHGQILLNFDGTLVNPLEKTFTFSRADTLRGSYGKYRQNNDLLFYDLNIRLDIENKFIVGWNSIRFKMLGDASRIQIDLFENMNVDSILFDGKKLSYGREFNAVFIDFPATLRDNSIYEVQFHYSGHPHETGRFGGIAFKEDSLGNPWIYTACQGIGASLWWPNKDQQPDEVDSMKMSISVPSDLVDVSNGRFMGAHKLGDGYTRYDWKIHYPINNYSVSLNIGKYTHFSEQLGDLTLDYYVLPYHLEMAKRQFAQTKPMLQCFEKYFGPYPFPKDGFKLIEVPYSGMEHQSAVTYGNLFKNGYLGRDWTGVGISDKFDFIIVHESGHEWFGNSVTASDVSDAWIQEGWCTYAEAVYVECMFGYEAALKYVNGYKSKVLNQAPIIGPTAVNKWPSGDQYFKGALFLNTIRHIVGDDDKWWSLIRAYADHFKYKNIFTSDVLNFFNTYLQRNLKPVFQQYLYYADLPVLQLDFTESEVRYRWQADVKNFSMPLKVKAGNESHFINPTSEWQSESLRGLARKDWQVATNLYYIEVQKIGIDVP